MKTFKFVMEAIKPSVISEDLAEVKTFSFNVSSSTDIEAEEKAFEIAAEKYPSHNLVTISMEEILMKNANKAHAINEMNTYINSLVPKLVEYVENNEIKTKTDGSLFEKNRKAISEIISCNKPNKVRCYFELNNLGSSIRFDTNYRVGEYSCSYIDGWCYLSNFEQLKTDFVAVDFVNAQNEVAQLEKQIAAMKTQINNIKYRFSL